MRPVPSTMIILLVSATALAGCKVDNRPLLARMTGAPPPPAGLPQPGGPYEASLPAMPEGGPYPPPPPQPIRYEPARAWPDAERAYVLDQTFYDVPPDYGFDYVDEEPWAWQAQDDSLMFAEPYGDAYRFYYYQPGADYPYFVEGPDYGYAYGPSGALVALFSAAGALLSADDYDRYYPEARRYWTRGYDLRRAYVRSPRRPVDPDAWRRRAADIARVQQPWIQAGATQPAWRQWRARSGTDLVQRYAPERSRRLARAEARGMRPPSVPPLPPSAALAQMGRRVGAGSGRRGPPQQMARFQAEQRRPPAMQARQQDAGARMAQARRAQAREQVMARRQEAQKAGRAMARQRAMQAHQQALASRMAETRRLQAQRSQAERAQAERARSQHAMAQRAAVQAARARAAETQGRNAAWRGAAAAHAAGPRPQAHPQPRPQARPQAHARGGHGGPGQPGHKHGR